MTFFHLYETAMMRYHLEGLPDTVQERVVLQSLINYGCAVFFKKDGSVLSLPGMPGAGGLNANGDPVTANVFSRNGLINEEVNLYTPGGAELELLKEGVYTVPESGNGVIVWETKSRYPFINTIMYYASCISDTLRTIDTARMWIKVPFIPVCERELLDSVKETFKAIQENDELIPVSTGIQDIKKFNILPVQESGESIRNASALVDWYEQQFRSRCGIHSNTAIDKKGENLTSDEININDSYTNSATDELTEYLQSQFDFVNQMLGTNIKVVLNNELQNYKSLDTKDDEEAGANESLNIE